MASDLLVIQRRHELPNPLDFEMDFWMGEIERLEREEDQERVRRGI